jgi:hypothetical protein
MGKENGRKASPDPIGKPTRIGKVVYLKVLAQYMPNGLGHLFRESLIFFRIADLLLNRMATLIVSEAGLAGILFVSK